MTFSTRAWSITEARNWAAPGGVRSTTRFSVGSAETSSSRAIMASRLAWASVVRPGTPSSPSTGTA